MSSRCDKISISVALVAVFAILVILFMDRSRLGRHERFVVDPAPRVYLAARELFENNGSVTYSDYKAAIPGADPVQFADIRKLWISGRLSLDNVRKAL